MGGRSKSSSSSTNINTSGQIGIEGDNLGVALSGVNDSSVNVTATDHGAVNAAFDMGGEMIAGMERVSTNSMILADSAMERGYGFASELVETNARFADSALSEFSASNSENLQMLAGLSGSQAAQNSENLKAVMDLSKHKQDGGASVQSKQQLIAFVAVAFIVGFVLVRAN